MTRFQYVSGLVVMVLITAFSLLPGCGGGGPGENKTQAKDGRGDAAQQNVEPQEAARKVVIPEGPYTDPHDLFEAYRLTSVGHDEVAMLGLFSDQALADSASSRMSAMIMRVGYVLNAAVVDAFLRKHSTPEWGTVEWKALMTAGDADAFTQACADNLEDSMAFCIEAMEYGSKKEASWDTLVRADVLELRGEGLGAEALIVYSYVQQNFDMSDGLPESMPQKILLMTRGKDGWQIGGRNGLREVFFYPEDWEADSATELSTDELQPFRELYASMTFDAVHARLGEPDRLTGHGIAIDVYELSDGSEVMLGWSGEQLIYVKHGEDELLREVD